MKPFGIMIPNIQNYDLQHVPARQQSAGTCFFIPLQGLSPEAFSRFFRQQTGQCVSRYINEVRLQHCRQLLLETDMTVKEIAFCCGFNTLAFFNRTFLRQYGCTPTECRERAGR